MAVDAAKLKVTVTADTKPGERDIKGFVERQANVLEKGFKGISGMVGLAATTAIAGMVVRSVTELSKLAEANRAVETSFQRMAAGAGASGDAMLAAMREAADGTISDYDLMLSANRAMMLGVADSADELARLMDIARARGQALGLSAQQAFNDIVTGLGRGSALILDNLGIVVELDEAYQAFARSAGKAVDELTAAEKKQALINAATADMAALDAEPLTNQFERMDAAVNNMKIAFGEMFSPTVTAAAESIANSLNRALDPDAPIQMAGGATANEIQDMLAAENDLLANQERVVEDMRANWRAYRDSLPEDKLARIYELHDMIEQTGLWDEVPPGLQGSVAMLEDLTRAEMQLVKLRAQAKADASDALEMHRFGEIESWNRRVAIEAAAALAVQEEAARATAEAWKTSLASIETDVQKMLLDVFSATGDESVLGQVDELTTKYQHLWTTLDQYPDWARDGIVASAINADQEAMIAGAGAWNTYIDALSAGIEAQTAAQAQLDATIDGMARGVSEQLLNVVGPEAFSNMDIYRAKIEDTYQHWIEKTGDAETAQFMAKQAADDLVASITQLHGGTLDEVADAAWRAESQIWGTAAAAEALMNLLGTSQGTVDNMFMGAVGRGFSAAGAQAMADMVNAEREALIKDMAEMGVSARDAAFALAEFDAATLDIITATTRAHSESLRETRTATRATSRAGKAAEKTADGLNDLAGMLGKIPGLFDATQVTEQDMRLAELGMYKPKADEYLRQLRDEMLNNVDWGGVDVETAASAIGWNAETARANAELFLDEFTAAWNDSSLFADPANIDKFLNMEAIQASLERQQDAAQGEKNLKALFGIGADGDVNAIAALGLNVQSGLASWLEENGMEDAGARLAEALAGGIKTDDMGEAAVEGMEDFTSSSTGQQALYDVGYDMGESVAKGVRDRIMDGLIDSAPPASGQQVPPLPSAGPSRSAYGANEGSVSGYGAGVNFTQQVVVRRPHEARMVAEYTAQEMYRRSRR